MRKYAILLGTILLGLASALSYAQAPVPFINLPLVPDATPPGGPEFTLTVNGTGFVSNSVVNWNGTALATQYVSQSQLTATVPAANVATANTGWVTVVTPAPGGGMSNTAFFSVTANVGNAMGFSLYSSLGVPPLRGNDLPQTVAVGDFNGDGKLDLAVTGCGNDCGWGAPGAVSVLLGDGTGNFTLASSPTTGVYPTAVAVGDFNGDGKLDLAVANSGDQTVSILLGDGAGNFTLASSLSIGGCCPVSVAVGDFNGDGKLDLAVANFGSDTVSILLGDGTGNFTLASSVALGVDTQSVAVGDFNGDGNLDLAVALFYNVSILLGDGRGNFTLASSPVMCCGNDAVAVGDFNGDGKLDLAVTSYGYNTVSILLGDGTGNFTLLSSSAVGFQPLSVAAGDFNGDGNLDLAITGPCLPGCSPWQGTASVLLGDGKGNFTSVSSTAVGLGSESVVAGDFNGDGKLDLAVMNTCGSDPSCLSQSTVSILLQAPPSAAAVALSAISLTFATQSIYSTGKPQNITLRNTGTDALEINSITASANFSQTNNCGSSVGGGGSCTISVSFAPQAIGTLTGSVTITDNAANSPQTVSLTGVGTLVTLNPWSLGFGVQPVGITSPPLSVTLTNHGFRALDISGIGFMGPDAGEFAQTNTCGTTVAARSTCTLSVTFTPQGSGLRTATLGIKDNGGGSPQTLPLKGEGK